MKLGAARERNGHLARGWSCWDLSGIKRPLGDVVDKPSAFRGERFCFCLLVY